MPRLKILSAAEQDEFDSPPLLSGDSRKAHWRQSSNRIYFDVL
jgi:hypothetical protein